MSMWLVLLLAACSPGPDAGAVRARVDALRGPHRPVIDWTLVFSRHDDEVLLSASADGATFERVLPAGANCAALTEGAAVVVLLLEGDLLEAEEARRRRVVKLEPRPVAEVVGRETPRPVFELGLAPGLSFSESGATGALVARAVARPGGWRLGLGVHLRALLPQGRDAVSFSVTWNRVDARLGPDLRVPTGAVELAVSLEPLLGRLWINARSASGNATFSSWDVGGALTARVTPLAHRELAPWAELSFLVWARRHRVMLENTVLTLDLPVAEVDLVVGGAWGW